jgi:hypothetical protein
MGMNRSILIPTSYTVEIYLIIFLTNSLRDVNIDN